MCPIRRDRTFCFLINVIICFDTCQIRYSPTEMVGDSHGVCILCFVTVECHFMDSNYDSDAALFLTFTCVYIHGGSFLFYSIQRLVTFTGKVYLSLDVVFYVRAL